MNSSSSSFSSSLSSSSSLDATGNQTSVWHHNGNHTVAAPEALTQSYLFYLALLYFAMLVVVVVQLARILWYKHNLWSFQFSFLVLCFIWSTLRGFYYMFRPQLRDAIAARSWLEWIPVNVEFATISMLVVFYASLAYKQTWRQTHRLRVLLAYAVTNVLFVCIVLAQCVYLQVTSSSGDFVTLNPGQLSLAQQIFVLVVYLILAVTLHVYMMKVIHVAQEPSIKVALQSSLLSTSQLFVTNSIIVVLFLSRCAYLMVVLLLNVGRGQSKANAILESEIVIAIEAVAWEIFPTGLIIAAFWKIPATGRARFKPNLVASVDINQYDTLPSPTDASVFSNPLRYDSDSDMMDGHGAAENQPLIHDSVGAYATSKSKAVSSYGAAASSYGPVSSLLGSTNNRFGSINQLGDDAPAYSPYNTNPFGRTPPVSRPIGSALPSGSVGAATTSNNLPGSSRRTAGGTTPSKK